MTQKDAPWQEREIGTLSVGSTSDFLTGELLTKLSTHELLSE